MMLPFYLLAALHLIFVHGPDGQRIELNVTEISSIREMRDTEGTHFGRNVNCIVFMTNGKFIGTIEECDAILEAIKKAE